jgi:hypothetical protein
MSNMSHQLRREIRLKDGDRLGCIFCDEINPKCLGAYRSGDGAPGRFCLPVCQNCGHLLQDMEQYCSKHVEPLSNSLRTDFFNKVLSLFFVFQERLRDR